MPKTAEVVFFGRDGNEFRRANYISTEYAMKPVLTHFNFDCRRTVQVDGHLCFNEFQAEKRLRAVFNA